MQLDFSFIIPVYNRPQEIDELLNSFKGLQYDRSYEIVIVEDGSSMTSEDVVAKYQDSLYISYYSKSNSGPGDSRNFGMKNAKGNYFIILDSDCILPSGYLIAVHKSLNANYVDCFGGPDTSIESFTPLQRAIDFAMTSWISTGGIRGGKYASNKFQPRSFNMGISREAFERSGGFGHIHPGEDPDLSIRLWQLGFNTRLIPEAFVYHKRRVSWSKFYQQVHKFGLVRPILNSWHPETRKLTYWFPSLFCLGLLLSIVLLFKGSFLLLWIYISYFSIAFILAFGKSKHPIIALMSVFAIMVQFIGYGLGFLKSTWAIGIMKGNPNSKYPFLFFDP